MGREQKHPYSYIVGSPINYYYITILNQHHQHVHPITGLNLLKLPFFSSPTMKSC